MTDDKIANTLREAGEQLHEAADKLREGARRINAAFARPITQSSPYVFTCACGGSWSSADFDIETFLARDWVYYQDERRLPRLGVQNNVHDVISLGVYEKQRGDARATRQTLVHYCELPYGQDRPA